MNSSNSYKNLYTRRAFTLGCLAGAAAASAQVPARPLRIVVPTPAGGGSDIMTRVIAQQMSLQLGQPVVVENRAGVDGVIGADYVARSAPDGTTLVLGSNGPMVVLPMLRGRPTVPYDPFKDFTPIGLVGRFKMVMMIGPGVPAKTLAEFVQLARNKPDGMNYASGNTIARAATLQLMAQTKISMVHVPYKGESAGVLDLMADRVQVMVSTVGASRPYLVDKKVNPLFVLGDQRSPLLPDVPSAREAGLRITVQPWAGFFGPAGVPAPVVERINQALRAAMATPEVREQAERLGVELAPATPAELGAVHRDEHELFRKLVQEDGVRFE